MKPCKDCKTPQACAKAGACQAKPMAMPKNGKKAPPMRPGQWK